ncbi:MAG TPA: hypothetical protein VJJ47_03290 [Candidatus Paceibacterota bacterium]
MRTFNTTSWLLVPATTGTNTIIFEFLNQFGSGEDYEVGISCEGGPQNGWAIYNFPKVERILQSAKSKKISFTVFRCEEGTTEGVPWKVRWESGKPTRGKKRTSLAPFSS